jgi:lipopolysaccharide/colanic/teichoic acid biosynthesis glycosyltransferase
VEEPQDEVNQDQTDGRSTRYAYLRSDGTLDIVIGSLIAGLGGYAYQFLAGRSLGVEGFAAIGILLTAHFLSFVIVLMPIEQFVIRRLTLGARGWVVPVRAVALAASTAVAAGIVVAVSGDDYFAAFSSRQVFILFVLATVAVHFFFAVGRGYLAGYRRFRSYGYSSAAASVLRLAVALAVAIIAPSVTGFAWAHVLGPIVIVLWRPWKPSRNEAVAPDEDAEDTSEKGLLSGLVLAAAASQALLLAGPLVASRLGATTAQFSVVYATLLIARAPLTLGYNLIARILPSFTQMAVRGERRELRSWARGIAVAAVVLSGVGALLGAVLGPLLVGVAFGSEFSPSPFVGAIAGAGVVLAAGGLFIGQILVAKGQSLRLAIAWMAALIGAIVVVALPFDDPVIHVVVAFAVGEVVALTALVAAALTHDPDETSISHGYLVVKRSLDIGGSMVALVLLFPVILIAAIAVKRDSPGPAMFRQQRAGREGELFWMIKLRTMAFDQDEAIFKEHLAELRRNDADDSDYSIKIDDDPRITKVGAFLRKWSIDELPNFVNVLKGSMSLVGPRPLVVEEAELIGLENPRFTVKPGVTGLAQVHGRDSIALSERTTWDDRYVESCTTKLDLEIMFATIGAVFVTPGDQTSEE